MLKQKINYLILKNVYLSKWTFNSLQYFPNIINFNMSLILFYKQKHKYFLFINLILLLLFNNLFVKTRFLFKTSGVNILTLNLRNQKEILQFIYTFVHIHYPLIDSFSSEFKILKATNVVKFLFLKFPLLFELNTLFLSLEYLHIFLNGYKFQLEFHFTKNKNNFLGYNLLQWFKLPLLIT